jgi:hypothetical protein
MTHKREPVGQAVNAIICILDELAAMALRPETYDEVAAEERALGAVSSRAQLILSFIDARRKSAPKLRVVKRT